MRLAPVSHGQEFGDEHVKPGNLFEHIRKGLAAAGIVAREGVLGAQSHGSDRIAYLMRDARCDPPQRGKTLSRCYLGGKRLGLLAGDCEAGARVVQRVDDAIQFALTRLGEEGDRFAIFLSEGAFDGPDMTCPNPHQPH
jgi:hypothetical protein